MLDRLSGLPLHRFFYISALLLIAIGVSLNKVVMTIGTIMLLSSWLLEADFSEKFRRMKKGLPFIIALSFFLLHLLGLLWTTDFGYGFHDLRTKLPLLVIPLVLGTINPITRLEFKLILSFFVGTVFLTTLLNFLFTKGIIPSLLIFNDFRDFSLFISHIRLSLMVDFAIFSLVYYLVIDFKKTRILLPLLLWLLYYSFFSQIISGFIYLFVLALISVVFLVLKSGNKILKLSTLLVVVGIFAITFLWLNNLVSTFYNTPQESKENPDKKTVNGRFYNNEIESNLREKGNLIFWYVCPFEVEREWNLKSSNDYLTGLDDNGFPLRYTLFRYMTAKGLRKDSLGFSKMALQDIANVQKGITNPDQLRKGMSFRILGLLNEYEQWKNNEDPNNKTLMQRFSYWEAGVSIFSSNLLVGVGTGDIQMKFDQYYTTNNSQLTKKNRHRSHNQFLSIGISFGVFGLALFVLFLLYPLYYHRKKLNFLHLLFICLMLLSFLPEDTLETQSGVTFFALFYCLFFFQNREKSLLRRRFFPR